MLLKEYQRKKKMNNSNLAKHLKIHVSMVTHYYAGRKNFSPKKALEIEGITNKKVTVRELLYPTAR